MPSISIEDWCRSHGISRGTYYNLKHAGKAPRTMEIGACVRITDEADREWCQAREAEASGRASNSDAA